jgi:hypothetical protein
MTKKTPTLKSSAQDKTTVLRRFLNEQWAAFVPHLAQFQWPAETARWHELVFCLLHCVARPDLPSVRVRRLTDALVGLDLVEVGQIAALADERGRIDLGAKKAALLLDVLEHGGLHKQRAECAIVALVEAASAVMQRHGGKIQRYLRQYGQMMLDDLPNQFSFSRLSDDDARLAFTLWLQNVLNMPIELWNAEVKEVCRHLRSSRETLVATADDLDINVALLDDVLSAYMHPDSQTSERAAPKQRSRKAETTRA